MHQHRLLPFLSFLDLLSEEPRLRFILRLTLLNASQCRFAAFDESRQLGLANLLSPSEHRWHLCAPVAIRTGRTPTCLWWTERASEVHRVSQLTSTRGGPLGLHFTVRERLAMASSFCLLSRCRLNRLLALALLFVAKTAAAAWSSAALKCLVNLDIQLNLCRPLNGNLGLRLGSTGDLTADLQPRRGYIVSSCQKPLWARTPPLATNARN